MGGSRKRSAKSDEEKGVAKKVKSQHINYKNVMIEEMEKCG